MESLTMELAGILVTGGCVLIAFALRKTLAFLNQPLASEVRFRWRRHAVFLATFLATYVVIAAFFFVGRMSDLATVIALLLFAGGAFVFVSTKEFMIMSSRLTEMSDGLESQVKSRTKELEIALEKTKANKSILRSFLDSSHQMMGVVEIFDNDIIHLTDNNSSAKFFGLTTELMKGKLASQMGAPREHIEKWLAYYRESQELGSFKSFEYEHKIDGQNKRTLLAAVNYIGTFESGRPRFSYIVTDVTAEKEAQASLLNAKEDALKSARSKSEFLANMSHEIRTPMNGIIGMANLLQTSVMDKTQTERVRIIQDCANSLLEVINDILDFSKLEAGKIELENQPFDVLSTSRDVIALFSPVAESKGLRLSFIPHSDTPKWIFGDITRFKQILTNLVSNALKFTHDGSVEVRFISRALADDRWELEFAVTDTGIGIHHDKLAKLFKSFSQVDSSTTRRFGGSGLGLAISKGLIEKMGGHISVESAVGFGSTFYFVFEAKQAEHLNQNHNAPSLIDASKNLAHSYPLQLLIAEDNRTNQLVLTGLLEKLGYTADIATNGLEVLEKMQSKSYDTILMDCHMPEMDGFEATSVIRRNLGGVQSQPRIIAVTASAMKEDVQRCLQAGMDAVIPKPIHIRELVNALKSSSSPRKSYYPSTALTRDPESADVMDSAKLFKHFSGVEDLIDDTMECLLGVLPDLLKDIEASMQARDLKKLELSSHTLKGASSNIFAERLVRVSAEISVMARANQLPDNPSLLISRLKEEAGALVHSINSFRQNRRVQ